jgi:hypothetical protein
MDTVINPLAADHHLPWFITAPGQSDTLLIAMGIFLIVVIIAIGNIYFQLHALPEKWAHHTSPVQIQIVAVLAILALFTHNHIFWIAALLLALVQFPDFSTPIYSMAESLARISGRRGIEDDIGEPPTPLPAPSTPTLEREAVTEEVVVIEEEPPPPPPRGNDNRPRGESTDA